MFLVKLLLNDGFCGADLTDVYRIAIELEVSVRTMKTMLARLPPIFQILSESILSFSIVACLRPNPMSSVPRPASQRLPVCVNDLSNDDCDTSTLSASRIMTSWSGYLVLPAWSPRGRAFDGASGRRKPQMVRGSFGGGGGIDSPRSVKNVSATLLLLHCDSHSRVASGRRWKARRRFGVMWT